MTLAPPALPALTIHDFPTDVVIKPDLFAIRCQQRPLTSTLDALLQTR